MINRGYVFAVFYYISVQSGVVARRVIHDRALPAKPPFFNAMCGYASGYG